VWDIEAQVANLIEITCRITGWRTAFMELNETAREGFTTKSNVIRLPKHKIPIEREVGKNRQVFPSNLDLR